MSKGTVVCIVGVPRSGTSLIAQAVQLAGVYFGHEDAMMPSLDNMNSEGFLEWKPILDIHTELAKTLHESALFTSRPLPENWMETPAYAIARNALIALIQDEFSGHPVWGWKDPRGSVFLPLWRDVLEELGYGMTVVVPFRNPVDVAHSLYRVWKLPFHHARRLWLYNMLSIREGTQGLPCTYIDYDAFVDDPGTGIKQLSQCLTVTDPRDYEKKVRGIIKTELRHSHSGMEALDQQSCGMLKAEYGQCLGQPPSGQPQLINTVAEYQDFASLVNLHFCDERVLWFYGRILRLNENDEMEEIAGQKLRFEPGARFEETFRIEEPIKEGRLFFSPSITSKFFACQVDSVKTDGEFSRIGGHNGDRDEGGVQLFIEQAVPRYLLEGDFTSATWITVSGKIENLDARFAEMIYGRAGLQKIALATEPDATLKKG